MADAWPAPRAAVRPQASAPADGLLAPTTEGEAVRPGGRVGLLREFRHSVHFTRDHLRRCRELLASDGDGAPDAATQVRVLSSLFDEAGDVVQLECVDSLLRSRKKAAWAHMTAGIPAPPTGAEMSTGRRGRRRGPNSIQTTKRRKRAD